MAQYLNSSPFPAELMRLRSKFKSHWAALFEQIAHAQSCRKVFQLTLLQTYRVRAKSGTCESETLSCLFNYENYADSLLCHLEEIGGEQLFEAIIHMYRINVSLRFALRKKWLNNFAALFGTDDFSGCP